MIEPTDSNAATAAIAVMITSEKLIIENEYSSRKVLHQTLQFLTSARISLSERE